MIKTNSINIKTLYKIFIGNDLDNCLLVTETFNAPFLEVLNTEFEYEGKTYIVKDKKYRVEPTSFLNISNGVVEILVKERK